MELSFCNDELKGYVVEILDRKEIIDEERGLCNPDDKITLSYLKQLETQLERMSKVVDELLRYYLIIQ